VGNDSRAVFLSGALRADLPVGGPTASKMGGAVSKWSFSVVAFLAVKLNIPSSADMAY